jgi:hypothetical protein
MKRSAPLVAAALTMFLWAVLTRYPLLADADPAKTSGSDASQAADAQTDASEEMIDPLGPNAACYVCHMTFVHEELAKVHKVEKIGCIECHGVSAAHANDEYVGATPPDIVFKRDQVDKSCVKCHDTHDAPATEVIDRFVQRKLPLEHAPICTDCHGQHRIDRAANIGR